MITEGTGIIKVNNREFIEYFSMEHERYMVLEPVITLDKTCKIDIRLFVHGGGVLS